MKAIKHYRIYVWSDQKNDFAPSAWPIQTAGIEAARQFARTNIRFLDWELRDA